MKSAPGQGVSVFQQPTNRANGLTRDLQGRLIACEHDSRRVTRQELDGKSITVIANSFQGRRLNRSNDVVVKSDGCIYFTDPWTNPAAQEQWDASRGLVRRPYPEGRQAGGPTCPAADAVRAGSERLGSGTRLRRASTAVIRPCPARLPTHQCPAGFLEVRHNVAAAPFAVASLGRRPLMDSATIRIPAVEDHDVFALGDKFHVGIRAWSRM